MALVVLPAKLFLPEHMSRLSFIKERLDQMFEEPKKHIVIGITNSKDLTDESGSDSFPPLDIFGLFLKGYQVLMLDPEETESMQSLVLKLRNTGSVKKYVKSSFVEKQVLSQLLNKVKDDTSRFLESSSECWQDWHDKYTANKLGYKLTDFDRLNEEIESFVTHKSFTQCNLESVLDEI